MRIDSTVNNRMRDQVKIIFSGFFVSFLVLVPCIVISLENFYVNIKAYRVKSAIDMYIFEAV